MKKAIGILLSLYLGLFIISGFISAIDDFLVFSFGLSFLMAIAAIFSFFAFFIALAVYFLMGVTPIIPKRVFLAISFFYLIYLLGMFMVPIYGGANWMKYSWDWDWVMSLVQIILGLMIVLRLKGESKIRWPLVEEKHLGNRSFSWGNLAGFALANIFVLAPAILVYFLLCAALAIDHFTAGFLTVRPSGLTIHVRHYARNDGREVELVPMAHVADAEFYRNLSESFPTNSIVLMEGVTDEHHLLTNGISYKRMAHSLGLVEQKKEFKPRGEIIDADIDVDEFSTNTIRLLNLVMLLHTKGFNPETAMNLAQYSPAPDVQRQLFDDLLNKRNSHLLEKLQGELSQSNIIIIPWGAGHMPGIAEAIKSDGFHLTETKDYTVIRFFHRQPEK